MIPFIEWMIPFIESIITGILACILYEIVSNIYLWIRSNNYVKKLNQKSIAFLNMFNHFLEYDYINKNYSNCTVKEFKEKFIFYNSNKFAGYNYIKLLSDLKILNSTLQKSLKYPYLTKRKFIYIQDLHEKFYALEYSLMIFAGNYNHGVLSDGTKISISIDDEKVIITDALKHTLANLNHILKIKRNNK